MEGSQMVTDGSLVLGAAGIDKSGHTREVSGGIVRIDTAGMLRTEFCITYGGFVLEN